jgi:activator of HSP90 ATPase
MMTDEMTPPDHSSAATFTRRQMIAGSAIGLYTLSRERTGAGAGSASITTAVTRAIVATRAIHDEQDYTAAPHRVYQIFLDAKQFSAFSGRSATISGDVGGAFVLFGGPIVGRNLELVADHRIVQAWRAIDWPEGTYSIARFDFVPQGAGTRIVLDHTGFPSQFAEHLEAGWRENYWEPLRKYLA